MPFSQIAKLLKSILKMKTALRLFTNKEDSQAFPLRVSTMEMGNLDRDMKRTQKLWSPPLNTPLDQSDFDNGQITMPSKNMLQ